MLTKNKPMAFLATVNPARAKEFYQKRLGLRLLSEDQFALAFSTGGIHFRIQKVEKFTPQPFTALGWEVANIHRMIAALSKAGILFERYPFLRQDDAGVWSAPSGALVAWFKDPDGSLLSLTQIGD
jgi:catechol 2,3-dioxygenase-like lactoylglutathione lyase family enzyme